MLSSEADTSSPSQCLLKHNLCYCSAFVVGAESLLEEEIAGVDNPVCRELGKH